MASLLNKTHARINRLTIFYQQNKKKKKKKETWKIEKNWEKKIRVWDFFEKKKVQRQLQKVQKNTKYLKYKDIYGGHSLSY